MIRNLFIPTALNGYYYIDQKIVSVAINKHTITAILIKACGKKRIIEQFFKQVIPHDEALSEQENVINALQTLFSTIGQYDTVTIVISSNQAVFKEMTVPFVNQEKIKLVVPFEVESLLPFPLHDATLDSIILEQDVHKNSSRIMVGAVKNEYIAYYYSLFAALDIPVARITIDVFELFGLYSMLPVYNTVQSKQQANALISLGTTSINVLIINNGHLAFVRVLSQGLYALTQKLEPLLQKNKQEVLDTLINFGFPTESEKVQSTIVHFFDDLLLSLQVSLQKLGIDQLTRISITGPGADIKGIEEFLTKITHVPTELFQAHTIVHDGLVTIKHEARIPQGAVMVLAAGLTSSVTQEFNLIKEMPVQEERILTKQIITMGALVFLLLGSLSFYSFFTIRGLKNETQESEQEAIAKLKKEFNLGKGVARSLEDANNRAKQELLKEENIWFALQNKSFLYYLQELSTRIDREGLGLNLKKLTLNENSIVMEGQVKDFEALKVFEEDLQQSGLFTAIPRLHDIKFAEEFVLDKSYKDH